MSDAENQFSAIHQCRRRCLPLSGDLGRPHDIRYRPNMVDPPRDSSGYEITHDDLSFLNISDDSLGLWSEGSVPLTLDPDDYEHLKTSLRLALESDGIRDADIRLQGSAARFFSGRHKEMPYARAQLVEEFRKQFHRPPDPYELNKIVAKLAGRWPAPGPVQRPFDALYVLGAHPTASDLDFQISSADARRKMEKTAADLQVDIADITTNNDKYGFYLKEYTERAFIHLSYWRTAATELVRRPVSIAIFDEHGPANSGNELSSHFRETDWMVS
jgi:hypothetical protein